MASEKQFMPHKALGVTNFRGISKYSVESSDKGSSKAAFPPEKKNIDILEMGGWIDWIYAYGFHRHIWEADRGS